MTTQTIPVFMVTNTDMVAYTATTMASVLYNTKSNIDFYIMELHLKTVSDVWNLFPFPLLI